MTAQTGILLRRLGPLIEMVCLIGLFRVRDRGLSVLGVPAEYPLYAGLAVGFAMVAVGLLFSWPGRGRRRDRDDVGATS